MENKVSLPNLEVMNTKLLEAQKDGKIHKFIPILTLNNSEVEELFNITFPHFQEMQDALIKKREQLLELQEKGDKLKFIPIADLSDAKIEELFEESSYELEEYHFWKWVEKHELSKLFPTTYEKALTDITKLDLNYKKIRDVSPLSKFINLTSLNLGSNSIKDISPLSNLINLTELDLYRNSIGDISPLSNLINLTELLLIKNKIFKVPEALNKLTKLTKSYNHYGNVGVRQVESETPVEFLKGMLKL